MQAPPRSLVSCQENVVRIKIQWEITLAPNHRMGRRNEALYAVRVFVDVDFPVLTAPLANERLDLVQFGVMTYEPAMRCWLKPLKTFILAPD